MSLAEEMAVPPLDRVTDASAGTVDRHATTETFESTDPATGAVVGVFPVHGAGAVRETVERARPAAARWRRSGTTTASSGSSPTAATSPGGYTSWPNWCTGRTASRTPTPSSRSPWRSTTWPGPATTPARCSAPPRARAAPPPGRGPAPRGVPAGMLAAGNAVVLKPAEHPATIGAWLAAAWRAAVPDAADASQVVTGFGGTGSSPCSWRARRQGRDDRGRRRRRAFPRLHRSGVRIVLTTPAINDLKSRNPTPRSF